MRSMGTLRGLYEEYVPFPGLEQSNLPTHARDSVKGVSTEITIKKEAENVLEI